MALRVEHTEPLRPKRPGAKRLCRRGLPWQAGSAKSSVPRRRRRLGAKPRALRLRGRALCLGSRRGRSSRSRGRTAGAPSARGPMSTFRSLLRRLPATWPVSVASVVVAAAPRPREPLRGRHALPRARRSPSGSTAAVVKGHSRPPRQAQARRPFRRGRGGTAAGAAELGGGSGGLGPGQPDSTSDTARCVMPQRHGRPLLRRVPHGSAGFREPGLSAQATEPRVAEGNRTDVKPVAALPHLNRTGDGSDPPGPRVRRTRGVRRAARCGGHETRALSAGGWGPAGRTARAAPYTQDSRQRGVVPAGKTQHLGVYVTAYGEICNSS